MAILDFVRQFIGEEPIRQPVWRILRITDKAGFPKEDDDSRRRVQCTYSDVWFAHVADEESHQIKPILFMQYCLDECGYPKHGCMHTSMVEDIDEENGKICIKTMNSIYVIRQE